MLFGRQGEILKTIDNIVTGIEEILIVIMMAYMTIMNFINVLGRYVFSASFSFTEELTVTVFVWVTMLGIAIGFKRNVHLGMSFVVDHCHGKVKAALILLSGICSLLFTAILLIYGIDMVQSQIEMGSTTPVLGMPQYVQGLAMPLCAVFIAYHVIEITYRLTKAALTDENKDGGAAL